MRTRLLLFSALAAGLLVTGCSAGSSSQNSSGAGGDVPAKAPAAGTGAVAQDPKTGSPDLSIDQRSIIYRGSLSVRVKNVDTADGEAAGIATTAGGYVGSDDRSTGGGDKDTATVQLRVPAAKFNDVLDQLTKLGTESQRQISTEDVTEQTVDLDARIGVQQARVDSARNLLSHAKTLSDLVMLENEVGTRESDLASLQAKKRDLADLTALSTITMTMYVDVPPAAVKTSKPGFLGGLKHGWHGLVVFLRVAVAAFGVLLPWLVVIGIPAWLIYRLYRRRVGPRRPRAVAVAGAAMTVPGWGMPGPAHPHAPQSPHRAPRESPAPAHRGESTAETATGEEGAAGTTGSPGDE